ncbi:MAG: uncharacterized protein H6R18_2934 [Proteobacteria bacterium]|nr:uncharacterized protein [Pseudomonadota bacterium]
MREDYGSKPSHKQKAFAAGCLLRLAIMLSCLLVPVPASARNTEQIVLEADRFFNNGQFAHALDIYQQALSQVGGSNRLGAEIINNIAATNMAQGDLAVFARNFTLARSLKQEKIGQSANAPIAYAGTNLLKNGGFEEGIVFPWGTGHYERADGKFNFGLWWNSSNASAFMKIDTAEKFSGKRSLLVGNNSPAAPHVFTTLSQRIAGLKPNTLIRIRCHLKGKELKPGAGLVTIDAAWGKRFALPSGTFDWQPFSVTINIGHTDSIDFRIVVQDTGWLWLDDIVVEELASAEEADALQRAESLFNAARYAEALAITQEAEEKFQSNESALRHYRLLAGRIDALMGNYGRAFANLQWVVDKGLVRGNIDLGDLYLRLGDFAAAERLFNQLIEQGHFKEDQSTISLLWHKLSQSYLAAGKYDQALQAQQRSYRVVKHIGDQHAQAVSLHQQAGIHRQKLALVAALDHLREAYLLAIQLGDRKLLSDIELDLAEIAAQLRQNEEARKYLAASLPTKEAITDRPGLVKALHLKGQLSVRENRPDEALASYGRAVEVLEEMAAGVGDISRQAKAAFVQQFARLYREYIELLIRRFESTKDAAYHRQAFQVVEQARSRVFSEMMMEARANDIFAATLSDPDLKTLLTKERFAAFELESLEKQMQQQKLSLSDRQNLTQLLSKARLDRQTLQETLRTRYPRYADLKTPKPMRIEDVQALLGTDEAALSYFVMPRQTALWVITGNTTDLFLLPISREELIRQSEAYRSTFAQIAEDLGRGNNTASLNNIFTSYRPEPAYALYQSLILPAEANLRAKRSVYLVPDDLLYKLPFETLLTQSFAGKKSDTSIIGAEWRTAPFWVNSHAITYLPSLSVLRSLRQFGKATASSQRPLVAFADPDFRSAGAASETGNRVGTRAAILRTLSAQRAMAGVSLPPLPESRKEAFHVAKILGAKPEQDVFVGTRASEYNVKHLRLNQYRNLLFATHGLMAGDFGPGTQPALALSFVGDPEEDGLLEMGEILGLDLSADLVVLSACNTASGSGGEDRGEGFAGLTRSFMYAGAKSLLVTQWSVESSSTAKFVQSAFARMLKTPKSEALAQAKRAMIAGDERLRISQGLEVSLSHPFFWAPFILVGEGGVPARN